MDARGSSAGKKVMERSILVTIVVCVVLTFVDSRRAVAEMPNPLEKQLQQVDPTLLAQEARQRGDPRRGAVVFYMSPAGCPKCHSSDEEKSPLGPNLASLGPDVTDEQIIEGLLFPSRRIRKGYETLTLALFDGRIVTGLVVDDQDDDLVMRDSSDLEKEITVPKDEIDIRTIGETSMMPTGIVSALSGQRAFFDLASYVMSVARGGPEVARELKPLPEQLVVKDDSVNLNHAGILRRLKKKDFELGRSIYEGLCINCHGANGDRPSLPTARAFGRQELKFGADPYRMFLTLTLGNGLMAPMSHLSPKERYQVIFYIQEQFMKGRNPSYFTVDDAYLKTLPKGTETGEFVIREERDFGPALASQLGRDVTSALTIRLGGTTVSYNLHNMDQAGVWQGGFLDLSATQHYRRRGEKVPTPDGQMLTGLAGWQWGHGDTLDYPRDGLRRRGPLPTRWFDYHGHYLFDDRVILSYEIDGRSVLEMPREEPRQTAVRHTLQIGPGRGLLLAVAAPPEGDGSFKGVILPNARRPRSQHAAATGCMAVVGTLREGEPGDFMAAAAMGETNGLTWTVDERSRVVLHIPPDTQTRQIEVLCFEGSGIADFDRLANLVAKGRQHDPGSLEPYTYGGSQRWPDVLTTVGYLGFQRGAYALDTLTLPDATPWNTWFRTSALDFFPDGRMVVSTHGGDIWIVSGIDEDLMELRWKRFAGGLYEPFGVKVVDGTIYVTCKDRLTRLHDLNEDGEADYYESFSADTDVSSFFHSYNFDLQRDSKGYFYYSKCGQYTSYALPGSVIKISPDGREREVFCTGFRVPNGMGILPDDRLTASDNQGNWMPASKISLLKPGGFYGYVQTHSSGDAWAPDGGRIDASKVIPPESFDQPIIWMPQDVDNSSGGQVWADDERWGPLSGHMLHTSFGKGWLYYLMIQDVGDVSQAAIIKLPFDFRTGIMRARVNPSDGQVYATGLDGWNGNGRKGLLDRGIQRLRYRGGSYRMVSDCRVVRQGLVLDFNFPLDPDSAAEPSSYEGECWNYHWRHEYGSDQFSPTTDERGHDVLNIASVDGEPGGRRVTLVVPDLKPVHQIRLHLRLKDRRGDPFEETIYWTINRVPE